MKFLSVDRIEGSDIICEDENQRVHVFSAKNASADLKEGDIIRITHSGNIIKDEEKTLARREKIIKFKRSLKL